MTNKLTTKQRVMRARWEYIRRVEELFNQLKNKYHLDDIELLYIIEDREGDVALEWESKIDEIRHEIEEKYNVCIEHEGDKVRVFAW